MSPGLLCEKDGKMDSQGYLRYLVDEIHTAIVATVDEDGLPVTAAIDMMDCDEGGLYFLTAKGKGFYDRLARRGFVAFTALKGEDTMTSVSISVRGRVRELGPARIPELFEKNPTCTGSIPPSECHPLSFTGGNHAASGCAACASSNSSGLM